MPYLDNKFPDYLHEIDCPYHKIYRLSIRGPDKKGNWGSFAYGLTCIGCGVVIRSKYYKRNLTKKQLEKQDDIELVMRPSLPDLRPLERTDDNSELSQQEIDYKHKISLIKTRLERIKYSNQFANSPMSHDELKHRKNIRSMTKQYNDDCICYPILKNILRKIWNPNLVKIFLLVRPTFDEMVEVLWYYPLQRKNIKRANGVRGTILNPKDYGQKLMLDPSHDKLEPDKKNYTPHPDKPHTWKLNMEPDKIGEYEKLVIEEAKGRMELMEFIIQRHNGSKIKVNVVNLKSNQTG
jgi:uncharacterized C2H2 Zn-finger protein